MTPSCTCASWFPPVPEARAEARCDTCGRPVAPDEIGLSRKLINRATTRYLCLACMAKRYDVPEVELRRKIEEFRAMGCTLFEP